MILDIRVGLASRSPDGCEAAHDILEGIRGLKAWRRMQSSSSIRGSSGSLLNSGGCGAFQYIRRGSGVLGHTGGCGPIPASGWGEGTSRTPGG